MKLHLKLEAKSLLAGVHQDGRHVVVVIEDDTGDTYTVTMEPHNAREFAAALDSHAKGINKELQQ